MGVPAPHFYPALRFPRRTGGFPRLIFTQHYGSRAARVDSRAPFFCSITVPAPHGWVPAPHFYSALGSRAAVVKTHAPFSCSITVPAPHRWVPAPYFFAVFRFPRRRGGFPRPTFLQHCGSRAARVGSRAPFLCSITVPAPHGWIPAPHFYAALRFPRRNVRNAPNNYYLNALTIGQSLNSYR